MFENIGNGICLITSGATSVPIDPVRSIENFSTGTRGARLAENFLKQNWNVIFLHRHNSAQPFRHRVKIELSIEKFQQIQTDWNINKNRLVEIAFNTLEEYFENLEILSKKLEGLKCQTKMILLAAAVSDFVCKPQNAKIDSSEEFSVIELDKVQKMILPLTTEWAPSVATFSFKLETDSSKIEKKARKYFDQGVKGIIGNELTSRRTKIKLILKDTTEDITIDHNSLTEIEELLVIRLLQI